MPGDTQSYRTKYSDFPEDNEDRSRDARDALVYGNPQPEDIRIFLYGQPREISDPETAWQTIQTGLASHQLDRPSLTQLGRALGDYAKNARHEILTEGDLARDYAYRDDLLTEKMDRIQDDLNAHIIQILVDRSQWQVQSWDLVKFDDFLQLARNDQWEQIPEKLREIRQRKNPHYPG